MANPQLEDGYTRIANELLEALYANRIPGQELRVVLYVLRKTYGYGKKQDIISYGQIGAALGVSRARAGEHVQSLFGKNILGGSSNGRNGPLTLWVNKNHDEWLPNPKKQSDPNNGDSDPEDEDRPDPNSEVSPGEAMPPDPVIEVTGDPDHEARSDPNNGAHNRKKDKKKGPPPDLISFSRRFHEHQAQKCPNHIKSVDEKKVLDGARCLEALQRIDGFDLESQIKPALRWGACDEEFWSAQLRSLAALRKKSRNGETKFMNLFTAYQRAMSRKKPAERLVKLEY